jgi:hypothetical protein
MQILYRVRECAGDVQDQALAEEVEKFLGRGGRRGGCRHRKWQKKKQ